MKLLVIDGNSILNRAFYGVRLLSTKDGRFTNGIFGFMNIFLHLLEEYKPDNVAVAFDVKAPTFRHKMYDAYKGTRKPAPSELVEQFPTLKELLGYLGYKVVEKQTKPLSGVKISEKTLENSRYKLVFDKSGAITSLWDKREQRELVKAGKRLNQMVAFQDTPYQYDNWEMTPYHTQNRWILGEEAQFETIEEGARAGFAITKRYGNSTVWQKVYLYADGVDRIDFVTDVEWKESAQLLKATFPLDIMAGTARYDVQFGHVERATHDNTSWDSARFESAAQKWVDLSENNYGVALLNDGKYGFGMEKGELSMTMVKSAGFPFEGANDNIPTFTYSLLPHRKACCNGGVVEEAYLLNRPFLVKKAVQNPQGELPSEYSMLACQTDGVMMETVKRAEDGNGIIVRMYEAYKERKVVKLSIPNAKEVALCDLNEKEVEKLSVKDGVVEFAIKPFEIVTIKIKGL